MNDREKLIELITQLMGDQIWWGHIEMLAEHLVANGVGVLPCKLDDDKWYIPLSNGQEYCTSYEAKMKAVK